MAQNNIERLNGALERSKRDIGTSPGPVVKAEISAPANETEEAKKVREAQNVVIRTENAETKRLYDEKNKQTQPSSPMTMPTYDDVKTYVNDVSFVRGLAYTSLPITLISLILLAAYRHDIKTLRASSPVVYKYPLMLALLLAIIAPFIIKSADHRLIALLPSP